MTAAPTPAEVHALLAVVAERRGVDFHDYRSPALERGIRERMERTGSRSAAVYRRLLEGAQGELDSLVSALVVPVTRFFRDSPVFEALARAVLPALAARARGILRAWVIGTATGEEAWSLAMSMATACEGGLPFQVLASDVDPASVDVARRGRYPRAAAAAVPAPLRERFLRAEGEEVAVADALRERLRFACHDLMGQRLAPEEAVVAAFDLVSVRNVLIYLDRRLQQKALERLLAVVEPGGALVLGSAESLPPVIERAFEPWPGVDDALRVFRRRGGG